MKFKTELSEFQKCLQKVLPAIPRKSTLPVLEHLHFSLKGDNLELIATDQEITIQTKSTVQGEADGEILVPGRRLGDIVKALGNDGYLEFTTDNDTFEIVIETISPAGIYTLKGLSHTEFLRIPELVDSAKPENIENNESSGGISDNMVIPFKMKDIRRLAEKTSFAVSTDEFRPAMNGVLFQFRGNSLNTVATDSFRLAKAKLTSEEQVFPEDFDVIIPSRAMEVLKKVDNDLIMSTIETRGKLTHVRFDFGETIFITRLIDEKFPPYESVIPEENQFNVLLDLPVFHSAVSRVSIITSDRSWQIRVRFADNSLTILGEDMDSGAHGNETIQCEFEGDVFEIAFNSKFLQEALANLENESKDNQVIVSFTEPSRPVTVRPNNDKDDILMLIMPVRFR